MAARPETPNCPRCKTAMQEIVHQNTFLDRCARCTGVFFDQGEMFAALGATADPGVWDSAETGGTTRGGETPCPRCGAHMLLQNVRYGGDDVEVDRCGQCHGIWLDATEADRIMKIGAQLLDKLRADAEKARKDLEAMPDDVLAPKAGGLLFKFLSLFKKKEK